MKTLIDNLQKYYGIYLLIVAVLFLTLWLPSRAVNRYAISTNIYGTYIIDTKTGQTWLYIKKYGNLPDYDLYNLGTPKKPGVESIQLNFISTEVMERLIKETDQ